MNVPKLTDAERSVLDRVRKAMMKIANELSPGLQNIAADLIAWVIEPIRIKQEEIYNERPQVNPS